MISEYYFMYLDLKNFGKVMQEMVEVIQLVAH